MTSKMKTFNEFLEESNGIGYQYNTPEEAVAVAKSFGSDGYHEYNGKFMPTPSHEELNVLLQQIRQKKCGGLDIS